jgi:hypothetical protein
MNQDIKTKWVAALRSGEYQQGRSQLRKDDKFCCLGVLCDIHSKETETEWLVNYYDDEYEFLSKNVMKWSGLKQKNPKLPYNTPRNIISFSSLNDSGSTFLEIANLIEGQL